MIPDRLWATLGRQLRKPSGWIGRSLGLLMSWEHARISEWAIDFLDLQSGDRVLDAGCGGGRAVRTLAGHSHAGLVCGLDHSRVMTRQAMGRNRSLVASGRVQIVRGDVTGLPYRDGFFDKVITIETFFFWDPPEAALGEMLRVLKPGGRCAIVMESSKEPSAYGGSEPVPDLLGMSLYSGSEVVRMLTALGFDEAGYEALPDEGKGWLCVLGMK